MLITIINDPKRCVFCFISLTSVHISDHPNLQNYVFSIYIFVSFHYSDIDADNSFIILVLYVGKVKQLFFNIEKTLPNELTSTRTHF